MQDVRALRRLAACLLACPLVAMCRIQDLQDLPECRLWSSGRVSPPFCPLASFAYDTLCLNMALFRVLRGFLEGFTVQMYVCMGLGICVDCGAFVRVYS